MFRFSALPYPPVSFGDFPPPSVPAFAVVYEFVKTGATWLHLVAGSGFVGEGVRPWAPKML